MARHKEDRRPRAAALLRALLPALLAVALAPAGGCSKKEFRLSGTVTISSVLQHLAPQGNTVMFIVAKNRGAVPVAVHRIVNPQFPVKFVMAQDDLLVPDIPDDTPLNIQVQMNSHGAVGTAQRGDLEGTHPNSVFPGERRVHIVVDRQL